MKDHLGHKHWCVERMESWSIIRSCLQKQQPLSYKTLTIIKLTKQRCVSLEALRLQNNLHHVQPIRHKDLELVDHPGKASLSCRFASCHALSANCLDESIVCRDMSLKGIKRWTDCVLLSKNIAFEPPRKYGKELVAHEGPSWHCKDIVELFECTLLCLRDKQEDHAEGAYVECGVETKGASRSHGINHTRERHG